MRTSGILVRLECVYMTPDRFGVPIMFDRSLSTGLTVPISVGGVTSTMDVPVSRSEDCEWPMSLLFVGVLRVQRRVL